MSASQARFLSLTARKTNVEYEGQQINQQRTALSNESSNYYSQLTSLAVPVPPSSADYTKVTYTFNDGNEKNTVTSIVATKDTASTGIYMLNYVQEIPVDTMVVNGTNIITRTANAGGFAYSIGANTLQESVTQEIVDALKVEDFNDNPDGSMSETRKKYVNKFTEGGIPREVALSYSGEQIINKLKVEAQYRDLAVEKYGSENWMVRYVQNSSTGNYEPVLYDKHELETTDYNEKTGASLSGIKTYVFGESTRKIYQLIYLH